MSVANYGAPVPVEVAIAFDVSGSMKKGDRGVLAKVGLDSFLTGMSTLSDPTVSFVPFTTVVKLDPATFRNKPWLTWSAHPLASSNAGTWDGCITDRSKPYDREPFRFPTDATNSYPATTCEREEWEAKDWVGPGNSVVLPTKALDTIKARLPGIKYDGYTDITLGVSWAATMLAPDGPIGMGKPWGSNSVKALLVISDGKNTIHRWNKIPKSHLAPHYPPMDPETVDACKAAKAKGIEVFAINVIEGDEGVLRACATSHNHYYFASEAYMIGEDLQKILEKLKARTLVALAR